MRQRKLAEMEPPKRFPFDPETHETRPWTELDRMLPALRKGAGVWFHGDGCWSAEFELGADKDDDRIRFTLDVADIGDGAYWWEVSDSGGATWDEGGTHSIEWAMRAAELSTLGFLTIYE